MKEITFLGWKLLVDDEQTKLAYQNIIGTTESCNCHWCSNFVAGREKSYPGEVLDFLAELGVDYTKEADLYQQARDETKNAIYYRWWFYFVGEIVEGTQAWKLVPKNGGEGQNYPYWQKNLVTLREKPLSFSIGFGDDPNRRLHGEEQFVPDALKPFDLVQIEFNAEIAWVLPSKLPQI
ncbi:MAG: hypothetical protein H7Z37_07180 [Pyrinomonadaceae bacterium]|nr:hypothetical protein [Pyrinomonadaceae bacterium]